MQVIRKMIKVQNNSIAFSELQQLNGEEVEIIILHKRKKRPHRLSANRQAKAHEIMNRCAGQLKKWTREELYDRSILS